MSNYNDNPRGLARPVHDEEDQLSLMSFGPSWEEHWWGMPKWIMGDATPSHRITVNFFTLEDLKAFAEKLGVQLSARTDSMWYPQQKLDEPKAWAYVDE